MDLLLIPGNYVGIMGTLKPGEVQTLPSPGNASLPSFSALSDGPQVTIESRSRQ
jgi:hypothetical protein